MSKKTTLKNNTSLDSISENIEKSNNLLFVTGRAGTGKSTLLRELCATTKKKYVVLAPTGIAAVNVGGETIHSFFRFKPGITHEEAKRYGERSENIIYEELELLIIDEVSMVRADLLDCIDIFLRKARKRNEPFGGVQVVLFGDLYQLEPIVRGEERALIYEMYDSAYFFSSHVFKELLQLPQQGVEFVELTKVFRQKDKEFIHLLDKIRKKKIELSELEIINSRYRDNLSDSLQEYVYLTSTNASAMRINNKNLALLPAQEMRFLGYIEGDINENNLPTEWEIKLKVHARVMLLNNDPDRRWINGTLGYISKIEKEDVYVKLDNGEEYVISPFTWNYYKYIYNRESKKIEKELVGSFTQYPIKLAWAITIHKSQGQTFDKSIIWLEGKAFANGQVYVALSRCRTLEGILLNRPIRAFDILVDDRVRRFLVSLKRYIVQWKLPIDRKKELLHEAIQNKMKLILDYFTLDDEQEVATVEPLSLKAVEERFILNGIVNSTTLKAFHLDQIINIQEYRYQKLED